MHSLICKALLFTSLILSFRVVSRSLLLEDEVIKENDNTGLIVGGASLVAIGGAGSVVIAINNKNKKYNEPSDEIKKEDRKDL